MMNDDAHKLGTIVEEISYKTYEICTYRCLRCTQAEGESNNHKRGKRLQLTRVL